MIWGSFAMLLLADIAFSNTYLLNEGYLNAIILPNTNINGSKFVLQSAKHQTDPNALENLIAKLIPSINNVNGIPNKLGSYNAVNYKDSKNDPRKKDRTESLVKQVKDKQDGGNFVNLRYLRSQLLNHLTDYFNDLTKKNNINLSGKLDKYYDVEQELAKAYGRSNRNNENTQVKPNTRGLKRLRFGRETFSSKCKNISIIQSNIDSTRLTIAGASEKKRTKCSSNDINKKDTTLYPDSSALRDLIELLELNNRPKPRQKDDDTHENDLDNNNDISDEDLLNKVFDESKQRIKPNESPVNQMQAISKMNYIKNKTNGKDRVDKNKISEQAQSNEYVSTTTASSKTIVKDKVNKTTFFLPTFTNNTTGKVTDKDTTTTNTSSSPVKLKNKKNGMKDKYIKNMAIYIMERLVGLYKDLKTLVDSSNNNDDRRYSSTKPLQFNDAMFISECKNITILRITTVNNIFTLAIVINKNNMDESCVISKVNDENTTLNSKLLLEMKKLLDLNSTAKDLGSISKSRNKANNVKPTKAPRKQLGRTKLKKNKKNEVKSEDSSEKEDGQTRGRIQKNLFNKKNKNTGKKGKKSRDRVEEYNISEIIKALLQVFYQIQ